MLLNLSYAVSVGFTAAFGSAPSGNVMLTLTEIGIPMNVLNLLAAILNAKK